MASADVVSVLRRALAGFRGDLTVADAAARSGLSLADAEAALRKLLVDVESHLAATEKGELVYSFPKGLDAKREGSFWSKAWRFLKGTGKAASRVFVRSFVGVFLVGYAVVFALLLFAGSIALSIAAEDSGPTEAAAYLLAGVVQLLLEALYWSVHPLTPYRAGAVWKSGDRKSHTSSFYEKVNNFFFGPPTPAAEDPLTAKKRVLARIRAKKGRIGILDVMQAAGVNRNEADALIAKLLLDYEGEIDVSDEGAITYRFEKLRRSVSTSPPSRSAFAERVGETKRELPPIAPFTGNSGGANAGVLALVLFNALMGYVGIQLQLPELLSIVPFLGSLALLAFPLARLIARPFLIARTRTERAMQRVRQLVVENAKSGVREQDLVDAFKSEAQRAPKEGELTQVLTSVASDVDVEVNESDDRAQYRFRDLEEEIRALERERANAPAEEREVGEVVFTSRE